MTSHAVEVILGIEPSRLRQLNRHTGDGPDDTIGDCYRTCIACLIGVDDPALVPHFVEQTIRAGLEEHAGAEDIAAARRWLRANEGLDLALVDIKEAQRLGVAFKATVKSHAGPWYHSIVVTPDGEVWCPTTGSTGAYSLDERLDDLVLVIALPYDPDPDALLAEWRESLAAA